MTEPDADETTTDAPADESPAPREGERIAKRLARAGLCSRRDAERWIAEGRVTVDGHKLSSPAYNVTDKSRITVDGKPIPVKTPTRLWRYHKPRGLLTTNRDPEGRRTIFDELPKELPRVITIGRLDYNSEGLLLLTNDGELARKLELPSTGWARRYRVRVNGDVDPAALSGLAKGITIEGVRYGAIGAQLDRQQGDNAWITMSLTEGKNREVRRICEHMGWQVSRLIRIAYGPFQLGLLEDGGVEEVSPRVVKEQMGAETGGAATAAEKRRLREETHDQKRRLKREETQGRAPKKLRPGKRDRDAKYGKPGTSPGGAAPSRRDDRDERKPRDAKPFEKRDERSFDKPDRGPAKPDRSFGLPSPRNSDDGKSGEGYGKAGKRSDRRLEKIEENFETREARSFGQRDDRPAPAKPGYSKAEPGFDRSGGPGEKTKASFSKPERSFVKRDQRAKPAARDHGGKPGERAKDSFAKPDRPFVKRDGGKFQARNEPSAPRDAGAKRQPDDRGVNLPSPAKAGFGKSKKDRRNKPAGGHKAKPGHAHRRRPS